MDKNLANSSLSVVETERGKNKRTNLLPQNGSNGDATGPGIKSQNVRIRADAKIQDCRFSKQLARDKNIPVLGLLGEAL